MTQHGKLWSYTRSKCRCNECRETFRLYQAEQTRKRFAYTKANGLPPDVEHGQSAYNNWGCRCEVCYAAQFAKNRAARERRKAAAS